MNKYLKILIFAAFAAVSLLRAYAADDFYYSTDMNLHDEGGFEHDGWECTGEVSVCGNGYENFLRISGYSEAVFRPQELVKKERAVLKMRITPETAENFTGVYIINSGGKACFSLAFNQSSQIVLHSGGWQVLRGYEVGREYELICILNMGQKTCDILINGERCAESMAFRNTPDVQAVKLYTEGGAAKFCDFCLYSNTVQRISTDNITLYGGEDISSKSVISVDFGTDMASETLNGDTVILSDAESGEKLDYRGEYNAGERKYRIFADNLPDMHVRLGVVGGSGGVKTGSGEEIGGSSVMIDLNLRRKTVSLSGIRTDLTANGYAISMKAANSCMQLQELAVIAVRYADEAFEGSDIYKLEINPCSETELYCGGIAADESDRVYAYIFDLDKMLPLCEKITLKAE